MGTEFGQSWYSWPETTSGPTRRPDTALSLSLSLSAVIRSEEWRIWIFGKKRFMYILFSLGLPKTRAQGGVWSWRRVAGRHGDSPSKGSSTSQPMKFNVAFPPGNAGKFPRKFPRNAPPFGEISIPIILSRGIIASFFSPPFFPEESINERRV